MASHLVAVLGLWLRIRTPQQGVAASTTETKTTPPLEKVPRHARCGELKRSACGHSVDSTRCGGVRKNPGTKEDGYITVWRLSIAGLSSVKKIAFAAGWEQRPPDTVLLQELNNRSNVATKASGHNDCLQAALGTVVALPLCCATLCRASACRSLALTSWRPLLSVQLIRDVAGSAWRTSTTLPWKLFKILHLSISSVAWSPQQLSRATRIDIMSSGTFIYTNNDWRRELRRRFN
ncbi:hypothetical protein TcBrA4_0051190 [Trypanosoma cruzi]|nr:hypothetical protein TcBrA4_0051190 [Trypanosoma cruzi]